MTDDYCIEPEDGPTQDEVDAFWAEMPESEFPSVAELDAPPVDPELGDVLARLDSPF